MVRGMGDCPGPTRGQTTQEQTRNVGQCSTWWSPCRT